MGRLRDAVRGAAARDSARRVLRALPVLRQGEAHVPQLAWHAVWLFYLCLIIYKLLPVFICLPFNCIQKRHNALFHFLSLAGVDRLRGHQTRKHSSQAHRSRRNTSKSLLCRRNTTTRRRHASRWSTRTGASRHRAAVAQRRDTRSGKHSILVSTETTPTCRTMPSAIGCGHPTPTPRNQVRTSGQSCRSCRRAQQSHFTCVRSVRWTRRSLLRRSSPPPRSSGRSPAHRLADRALTPQLLDAHAQHASHWPFDVTPLLCTSSPSHRWF